MPTLGTAQKTFMEELADEVTKKECAMPKTRLMMSVRPTIVGRYEVFQRGTQKVTGYKSRWESSHGTRFYESRRFDTEREAADAGYRWFDKQADAYTDGTACTLAAWYRKR